MLEHLGLERVAHGRDAVDAEQLGLGLDGVELAREVAARRVVGGERSNQLVRVATERDEAAAIDADPLERRHELAALGLGVLALELAGDVGHHDQDGVGRLPSPIAR